MVFDFARRCREDRSAFDRAETEGVKLYTLRFSKPVSLTGDWNFGDPKLRAAEHRAIKTRREAIRRKLRRKIGREERDQLTAELQALASLETQLFGVSHRATHLPLGQDKKPIVPRTARGKRHVPMAALPLNAKGRRYVPSARQIVATAVFQKYVEKDNLPMALAKLSQIDPSCEKQVRKEAETNPKVRRALNRLGSDVKSEWPPKPDELLVIENFYATTKLDRPLYGVADHVGVRKLCDVFGVDMSNMTLGRYRRILQKFRLPML
jgi:hypothetical protein